MPAGTDHGKPSRAADAMSSEVRQPRVLHALTQRGDLAVAALIVAVIALLILPLPTAILDTLIAFNLAASIALLMLSLYIPSALGLSTFPSLLLLTTLFRLSLNIASTKLILLEAHAGQVIETFGRLIVGGNVVVGLVVFLIIAIVQFIVIAKGAERVAEVGARFSLDGMPGKQMSIDADLRAGIIDKEEAQRRRRDIEQESQLHGAMDGAMKFVKGDAIASIIIAFVNIVAGIAIGATMHRMTMGEAVAAYAVLSVGDGMVSQIPSLFVSIAAGMVITRVDGKSQARLHLGAQIAQQVLAHPTALLMAAAIIGAFLLVPGFPLWQFLGLALALAALGYFGRTDRGRAKSFEHAVMPATMRDGGQLTAAQVDEHAASIAVPLRVRIAPNLRAVLSPTAFDAALEREKNVLAHELGLPFPGLRMSFDESLVDGHYAVDVQEMQVAQGNLQDDKVVALGMRDETTAADGRREESDAHVPAAAAGGGESAKASSEQTLARHVAWAVRRHAEAFVGMQEVHALLARAAAQLPDLTAEVQRVVPLQRIADVLRRLVQEGVSIRYLREICESLVAWGPREKDIVMLTEYVRVDLGRFIARRFVDSRNTVRAVVLDGDAEKAVRESIQQGAGGSFLALPPEAAQALTAGADSVFGTQRREAPLILLAPMDVRRYLKKFLGTRFAALVVLSFQELPAHVHVQPIGRLGLLHAPQRRSA